MSLEQEVELIRNVPILSELAPAAQKMICFASERVSFEPGRPIFRQGDFAEAAYVLIEGTVEITIVVDGAERRVNRVGRNAIVGEAGIIGDLPRSATATAVTRVEALRVSKDVFRKVIHGNPDAALRLACILAQRLANTTVQLCAAV
jgi:CRP-like cAMP-binding protein